MIGRMRHRVQIQARSTAQDAAGQPVETWTTTATVWADVRPVSGREHWPESGERAELTHEISMRYGPTVTPKHRIVFGTRTFDIEHVFVKDERDRFLDIKVVEHAG